MNTSIGFKFHCDNCWYQCFMVVHYSTPADTIGYKCPGCHKYFEHEVKESTAPTSGTKWFGIGYDALYHHEPKKMIRNNKESDK